MSATPMYSSLVAAVAALLMIKSGLGTRRLERRKGPGRHRRFWTNRKPPKTNV